MPEHVHLLISEPERSKLSVVIQMLKQITSQKLRAKDLLRFWPAPLALRIGFAAQSVKTPDFVNHQN